MPVAGTYMVVIMDVVAIIEDVVYMPLGLVIGMTSRANVVNPNSSVDLHVRKLQRAGSLIEGKTVTHKTV